MHCIYIHVYTHIYCPLLSWSLAQVNVKKPMKDETHFEVVESGRYITVLLGKALSVVWDGHLAVSVFLKRTYQVGGLFPLPPSSVCLHLQLPEQHLGSPHPQSQGKGGWSASSRHR